MTVTAPLVKALPSVEESQPPERLGEIRLEDLCLIRRLPCAYENWGNQLTVALEPEQLLER